MDLLVEHHLVGFLEEGHHLVSFLVVEVLCHCCLMADLVLLVSYLEEDLLGLLV